MTAQIEPGTILGGKYRVERVLGQGGIGVVLAARHVELDEPVAIKMLLPEHAGNADIVTRFMREGRAAIKIKSEHVARVTDVGRLEDGAPYLVMEYLSGCDLSELIVRRGTLPVDIAVLYLLQACEALAEAHRLGIVHRDFKPSNLYLITRPDGTPCVKVLDFGISKIGNHGAVGPAAHSLTRTQGLMGSPLYMSPEQLNTPRDVDQRADVWALGVILFELLTGQHPFTAEELPGLIVQIVTAPPRSLRAMRAEVPATVEAVIERCLTKQRDSRFQNVGQLAGALLPFSPHGKSSVERVQRILAMPGGGSTEIPAGTGANAVPATATLTPLGSTTGDPRSRSSLLPTLLVAGAVLFGVVGVSVWAFTGRTPPTSKHAPNVEKDDEESADDDSEKAPADMTGAKVTSQPVVSTVIAQTAAPPPSLSTAGSAASSATTVAIAPVVSMHAPIPSPTKVALTPAPTPSKTAPPAPTKSAAPAVTGDAFAGSTEMAVESPLDAFRSLPPDGLILPGTRFRLRSVLGQGAQGIAWLADDEQMRRRVVIKALLDLTAPDVANRFTREERVLAAIRHPSIVTIYEVGILPNSHPYYVMEWIDARPLGAWLREGHRFSVGEACTIMAQVCFGLRAAHQEGIVHRDVKPANILLLSDGRQVKVIDFGIAKRIRQTSLQRTVPQTAQGTTLGTPRYLSPEQALAHALTPASDLYSVGVVLYLLFTGRTPFDGAEYELLLQHVNTPAPTLREANCGRNFSSEIEALTAKLLQKNPNQRYQDGNEVGDLLLELARREGANLGSHAPAISMRAASGGLAQRQAESTESLPSPGSAMGALPGAIAAAHEPTGALPSEPTSSHVDPRSTRERTLESAPQQTESGVVVAASAPSAPVASVAYSASPAIDPSIRARSTPQLVPPGTQMAVANPITNPQLPSAPAWGRTSPGTRRRSMIAIAVAIISLLIGATALIVTFTRAQTPSAENDRRRADEESGHQKHVAAESNPSPVLATTDAVVGSAVMQPPIESTSTPSHLGSVTTPPTVHPTIHAPAGSKAPAPSALVTPSAVPSTSTATVAVPSSKPSTDGVPDDRL